MQPLPENTNLSPEELGNSTLYRGPVDPANWFGIRKGFPNLGYVKVGTVGTSWGGNLGFRRGPERALLPQNHLQVLLLLVFEAVVYRRQQYHRKRHQLVAPVTDTIFEDISREHLDLGLVSCAKYLINYFYYKFGLEVGALCVGVGGWGGVPALSAPQC